MTERWHHTKDLAGLPGMPNGPRPITLHGPRRGWVCREVSWGRRTRLEWLESSLPQETQAALRQSRGEEAPPSWTTPAAEPAEGACPGAEEATPPPAPASSASLPHAGRAAVADARAELVLAFGRWHAGQGLALVPALREWTRIYNDSGAGISEETRALVPAVAWNTLHRHRNAFLARGVMGLLPGTGGRTGSLDADQVLRETAEALLFERPHHTTAKQICRALAARHPDRETPSISTIRRFVRRWRADNAHALSAVADPDGHRSRLMPSFGDAAEGVERLNQLWELDSTTADVMCSDGRRYAIVAAIDVWSRRARAMAVPTSRTTAIAALVRRCLLDWGVPETVRTDEGADYTSRHLGRVFAELGVEHEVLPPYSPDRKPFIERFIETISHDLFCQLAGFTGHNVAQAEILRARKSFAARRGEEPVATFRCGLTAEKLQAKIDAWCETLYGREPHAGLGGATPHLRAASWAGGRRRVDERGLDVLLAEAAGDGRRKVAKKGIHVDGGEYIAAELGFHMGDWVHVRRDPADWGRIFVFTDDGEDRRFVCVAEDPVRTGIDRREVAARARANWKARSRADRQRARDLKRRHDPEAAIAAVLDAAEAEASRLLAFPAPMEVHRTAALDAAAEAQDAADEADAPPERKTGTGGDAHIELFKRFYQEGNIHD